jgi:glycine/D-amino acid oxidase-like deaminating enzyme
MAELGLRGDPVGAIVQRVAASLSPYKLVSGLWAKLLERYPEQLNIQTNTPALSIVPSLGGRCTVQTPRGAIEAKQVLLAMNGYTSTLLPQFTGLIRPVRNGMVALPVDPTTPLIKNSDAFFSETQDGRKLADNVMQTPRGTQGKNTSCLAAGGRTL